MEYLGEDTEKSRGMGGKITASYVQKGINDAWKENTISGKKDMFGILLPETFLTHPVGSSKTFKKS